MSPFGTFGGACRLTEMPHFFSLLSRGFAGAAGTSAITYKHLNMILSEKLQNSINKIRENCIKTNLGDKENEQINREIEED